VQMMLAVDNERLLVESQNRVPRLSFFFPFFFLPNHAFSLDESPRRAPSCPRSLICVYVTTKKTKERGGKRVQGKEAKKLSLHLLFFPPLNDFFPLEQTGQCRPKERSKGTSLIYINRCSFKSCDKKTYIEQQQN